MLKKNGREIVVRVFSQGVVKGFLWGLAARILKVVEVCRCENMIDVVRGEVYHVCVFLV